MTMLSNNNLDTQTHPVNDGQLISTGRKRVVDLVRSTLLGWVFSNGIQGLGKLMVRLQLW